MPFYATTHPVYTCGWLFPSRVETQEGALHMSADPVYARCGLFGYGKKEAERVCERGLLVRTETTLKGTLNGLRDLCATGKVECPYTDDTHVCITTDHKGDPVTFFGALCSMTDPMQSPHVVALNGATQLPCGT